MIEGNRETQTTFIGGVPSTTNYVYDDAYIESAAPTVNHRSSTTLQVDNSPVKQFLLKFDVSGVNGQSIASAKLRLYNVDAATKGGDFYRVADNTWQEGTLTWNTAPARPTGQNSRR